eukprot:COSAG04_NODE_683_length_11182_cov_15.270775_1_plen_52_part_00
MVVRRVAVAERPEAGGAPRANVWKLLGGGKKIAEDLAAARGRLQELREAQA